MKKSQRSSHRAVEEPSPQVELSRRERQLLDVLYRCGRATAAEVRDQVEDAPSYSAVRALLRILEQKGHVRHEQEGPRYVYSATVPRQTASRSALRHLVSTFFGGSGKDAMAALIDLESDRLSDDDFARLRSQIDQVREEGR